MSELNTSTHKPLEISKFLGISRAVPPWQLPVGMFYDSLNFRFCRGKCEQFPRKIKTGSIVDPVPLLAVLVIPDIGTMYNQAVVVTSRSVYKLATEVDSVDITSGVKLRGTANDRFSSVMFENKFYVVNRQTPVFWTDGSRCGRATTMAQPCGRYIEVFYDHLVVAGCSEDVRKVRWSNLRRFDQWNTERASEADYFQFLEGEDESFGGITGCKRLNEFLVVYTSSQIWVGAYVGLPKVMQFRRVSSQLSNDCQYGLLAVDKIHMFPSFKWRNFFVFDGTTPEPIGDDIADYFFNDVSTDMVEQQATWAYFDKRNHEAVWVYKSVRNTGHHDRAVVFNLLTKKWYPMSAEKLLCYAEKPMATRSIDRLGSTIDGMTGTINSLAVPELEYDAVWGGPEGSLLREKRSGDATVDCEEIENPFIETGDVVGSEMMEVKETDTLLVNAALGDASGLKCEISVRKNLSDAVTFVELTPEWTPTVRDCRLTHKKYADRVIRYRIGTNYLLAALYEPIVQLYTEPAVTVQEEMEFVATGETVEFVDPVAPIYFTEEEE